MTMRTSGRICLSASRSQFNAIAMALSAAIVPSGCAIEVTGPNEAAASTQGLAVAAEDAPQQEITIASLPDSRCDLTAHDSADTMEVWADDEGLVHLWAAPTETFEDIHVGVRRGG